MRMGLVRWSALLVTVVVLASLAAGAGCFRRQAESPPPAQPGSAPEEPSPAPAEPPRSARAVLEPGLKLIYRDENTGEEVWTEQCALSTLGDHEVLPVVTEDGQYVSYVMERDGWLVEVGARDPNGRSTWPQPFPCYPLDPKVGVKWEGEQEGGIIRHEIEAIEEITVPAGTFRAARVRVSVVDPTTGQEEAGPEQRFWYDVESGIVVKNGSLVLVKQERVEPPRPDPGLPQ